MRKPKLAISSYARAPKVFTENSEDTWKEGNLGGGCPAGFHYSAESREVLVLVLWADVYSGRS